MGKLTATQEAMARSAFERFLNECATTPVLPYPAKDESAERERRLWISVLFRALADAGIRVRDVAAAPDGESIQVLSWFLSTSTAMGSFLWLCDYLDLDPCTVRNLALRRVKPRKSHLFPCGHPRTVANSVIHHRSYGEAHSCLYCHRRRARQYYYHRAGIKKG